VLLLLLLLSLLRRGGKLLAGGGLWRLLLWLLRRLLLLRYRRRVLQILSSLLLVRRQRITIFAGEVLQRFLLLLLLLLSLKRRLLVRRRRMILLAGGGLRRLLLVLLLLSLKWRLLDCRIFHHVSEILPEGPIIRRGGGHRRRRRTCGLSVLGGSARFTFAFVRRWRSDDIVVAVRDELAVESFDTVFIFDPAEVCGIGDSRLRARYWTHHNVDAALANVDALRFITFGIAVADAEPAITFQMRDNSDVTNVGFFVRISYDRADVDVYALRRGRGRGSRRLVRLLQSARLLLLLLGAAVSSIVVSSIVEIDFPP